MVFRRLKIASVAYFGASHKASHDSGRGLVWLKIEGFQNVAIRPELPTAQGGSRCRISHAGRKDSIVSHLRLERLHPGTARRPPWYWSEVFPAMAKQQSLRELWLSAQHGRMSPWEQAKALALREACRELHGGKVNLPWISARVTKSGGGRPQEGPHA